MTGHVYVKFPMKVGMHVAGHVYVNLGMHAFQPSLEGYHSGWINVSNGWRIDVECCAHVLLTASESQESCLGSQFSKYYIYIYVCLDMDINLTQMSCRG